MFNYFNFVSSRTAAADNVDFSGVTSVAVGIINKLDHTQRGVANTESTVAQLERSLKTAKAGTTISGIPPPRPTTQAPVPQSGAQDARRASINFSVKDLAALRKKRAEEASVAGSKSGVSGTGVSGTGRVGDVESHMGALAMEDNDDSTVGAEFDDADPNQLPPGWIEKTDKKSGRLYYANE